MIKKILLYLVLFIAITSCEYDNSSLMPNVTGKAGELVIVMETEDWKKEPGDLLRNILSDEVEGLPQSEPILDLVQIPKSSFSDIFKSHRNILRIRISGNVKKSRIVVKNDVYAKPQIVIFVEAKDADEFVKLIDANGKVIRDKILEKERKRIITNYRKYEETGISQRLRKFHNLSINVPAGYTFDVDTNNFIWISHETPLISQGIFVYYYNYLDTSDFQKENLINIRDSYLKKYVHGPIDNTYMTTEKLLPVSYREFLLKKRYTVELKGLWKLQGPDFMGGPFISHSIVDIERNRIITVDGYVFSPKYDNRNYLRQIEAILYTLKTIPVKNE